MGSRSMLPAQQDEIFDHGCQSFGGGCQCARLFEERRGQFPEAVDRSRLLQKGRPSSHSDRLKLA